MNNNLKYKQCTRCVMDSSDPEITFNSEGHCNHCSNFIANKRKYVYQGQDNDKILANDVERIKQAGKGKKYDCIVGISGGADSCYAAYICKKFGLRALLVHMDNGWNSETSVSNIEVIAKALDFDYKSYVLNWDDFKDVQLSFLKASVPEIETPTDIAILEYLHKAAAEYQVKHIIMGGNYVTEGILPKSWHYDAKDKKYSEAIQERFGTKKVNNQPSFGFWQEMYYKFVKRVRIVYILNNVPYSKKLAITTLEGLGWKDYGQKHHESFYTKIVQSYILPVKFNIDYRKPTLSNKICTGVITRDQAIELLKKEPYSETGIKSDIEYVCKKLGISTEEFYDIMNRPPKSFSDYPNNKGILEFLYSIYRIFKNQA